MHHLCYGVVKSANDLTIGSLAIIPNPSGGADVILGIGSQQDQPTGFGILAQAGQTPKYLIAGHADLWSIPVIDITECARIVPTVAGLRAAIPLSHQHILSVGDMILSDQKPCVSFRGSAVMSSTSVYGIDDGLRKDPAKIWNLGLRIPEWRIEIQLPEQKDWLTLVEGKADVIKG